jgi:hypothetical protein
VNERTVITSAAAIAAIGLLSLFLAYRHEPSAAEPDPASAVSTIAPASTAGGTVAVRPEGANTTEAVSTPTIVQQCQQAAYLAYVPTNIPDEALPPVAAQTELCVPISALRPDETIVGAFLTEDAACDYRNQHPGTSVRGLQVPTAPEPCK